MCSQDPWSTFVRGRSIVELLAAAEGVTLAAIFSPEHGYAAASESENIASGTTKINGKDVPLHSLYKGGIKGMRPTPEQLQGLDVLVFDIQDIGARFYTYLATMGMALEEAKTAGVDCRRVARRFYCGLRGAMRC